MPRGARAPLRAAGAPRRVAAARPSQAAQPRQPCGRASEHRHTAERRVLALARLLSAGPPRERLMHMLDGKLACSLLRPAVP